MRYVSRGLAGAGALLLASTFAGAALAQQPLAVVVRPVATVVQAPFQIVGGILGVPVLETRPPAVFNGAAARRHAIGYRNGVPILRARSLRATGPRYVNPPNADWSRPLVLSEGAFVPNRVPLLPVVNASVPGLVPNAPYHAFVSPLRNRVVFVDPVTYQVARVIR